MRITKVFVAKLIKDPVPTISALSNDDIAYVITKANDAYHNKDPLFTDDLYDLIKDSLEARNANHASLKAVGAPVSISASKKVKLPYFMGSMDKNKGEERSLVSFKSKYKGSYIVSDKLDGVSALLHATAEGGVKMYTRGDGTIGQEITHIISAVGGIPDVAKLMKSTKLKQITVRGELIMTKADFEKVSAKGANPRNMVSGVVNAKKPDMSILKLVRFVAYTLFEPSKAPSDQLAFLNLHKFNAVHHQEIQEQGLTFPALSEILLGRRNASPFEIDGIIVTHNMFHDANKSGNPEWAFAFKSLLTQETAEVTVAEVEWNVSKDGYFVPVVIFNPVNLDGVTIQRASGFNGEFIQTNKIGPGSRLLITRSGQVIPYIMEALTPSASGAGQLPPTGTYDWTESGKDIVARGESKEISLRVIENFFEKADIAGIRAGTIAKLYDAGINSIQKILQASEADFLTVDGIQQKGASKMADSIKDRMKSLECVTLMDASNAFGRGFGEKRLKLIVTAYPRIVTDASYNPSVAELNTVDGISTKTAEAFLEGLQNYRDFIEKTKIPCGNQLAPPPTGVSKTASSKMAGQLVVFSGFRSDLLKRAIEEAGGSVADTFTKKTTILVVKDTSASTSKIAKARDNGTLIMSVAEIEIKV